MKNLQEIIEEMKQGKAVSESVHSVSWQHPISAELRIGDPNCFSVYSGYGNGAGIVTGNLGIKYIPAKSKEGYGRLILRDNAAKSCSAISIPVDALDLENLACTDNGVAGWYVQLIPSHEDYQKTTLVITHDGNK